MPTLNLKYSKQFDNVLKSLSEKENISKAEVIYQAVCYYIYFSNEVKKGNKVVITKKNSVSVEVVIS